MTARTSNRARALGFRSMSEARVAAGLDTAGVGYEYERATLKYRDNHEHTYKPDFQLPNGVLLEVKGRFSASDRRKLLLVKSQNPDADVRLVFDRPHAPITKGSHTSNAAWCDRHGFLWCGPDIPSHWLPL